MEIREQLARVLCEQHNIDPDREFTPIRKETREALGEKYKLWEYQAKFYVDPLLESGILI